MLFGALFVYESESPAKKAVPVDGTVFLPHPGWSKGAEDQQRSITSIFCPCRALAGYRPKGILQFDFLIFQRHDALALDDEISFLKVMLVDDDLLG